MPDGPNLIIQTSAKYLIRDILQVINNNTENLPRFAPTVRNSISGRVFTARVLLSIAPHSERRVLIAALYRVRLSIGKTFFHTRRSRVLLKTLVAHHSLRERGLTNTLSIPSRRAARTSVKS